MTASPGQAPSPLDAVAVVRSRRIALLVPESAATPQRLATYLSLRDRPVLSLLARDRVEPLQPGRYLYRSRPLRLLGMEIHPSLQLRASWRDPVLEIVSESCQILGLGPWARALAFALRAHLRPGPQGLEGELEVSLRLSSSLPGWGRSLTGRGLEQVVDRIERRVQAGLRDDLRRWLLDTAVSG
jgi:hypothetical protein